MEAGESLDSQPAVHQPAREGEGHQLQTDPHAASPDSVTLQGKCYLPTSTYILFYSTIS